MTTNRRYPREAIASARHDRRWIPVTLAALGLGLLLAMGEPLQPNPYLADAAGGDHPPVAFFPMAARRIMSGDLRVQPVGAEPSGVLLVVFPECLQDCGAPMKPVAVLCKSQPFPSAVTFRSDELPQGDAGAVAFSLSEDVGGLGGVTAGESPFQMACSQVRPKLLADEAAFGAFKRSFEGGPSFDGVRWHET